MPQLEREPTDEWEARERRRFELGLYKELPSVMHRYLQENPSTKQHHAHVCLDGVGMVSYTADPERGKSDTQTKIKARKYAKRFLPEFLETTYGFSESQIDSMIEEWAREIHRTSLQIEVLLAMNPDHIRWVLEHSRNINDVRKWDEDDPDSYEYLAGVPPRGLDGDSESKRSLPEKDTGCPSCMTYLPFGRKDFTPDRQRLANYEELQLNGYSCGDTMPCEVMGFGDLAIAHIVSPDNPNLVKARTVCWPARKIYLIKNGRSTIYGKHGWDDALESGLREMGYRLDSIVGARLYRWEHNGSVIAPYLDGESSLKDYGSYLAICHDSEKAQFSASSITGIAEPCNNTEYCFSCGEYYDEDEMSNTYTNDGQLCYGCEDDYFSCDNCGEVYHNEEYREVEGTGWCEGCYEDEAFCCDHCGYSKASENGRYEDKHGDNICTECVDDSEEYAWMDNGGIGVVIEYVVKVKRCLSTDEEEELSREEA